MSAKKVRSDDSVEDARQNPGYAYEDFNFDSRPIDGQRRQNIANGGLFTVKRRHLIIGVGILLIVVLALIAVGGFVVYSMSKCQECQPQPLAQQSTATPQQAQTEGTGYASGGGPSQTICLPRDPQFGNSYLERGQASRLIYNAEYEMSKQTQAIFGEDMDDQDVPCAVCEVKGKSAILMIPARMECYNGWTKEYSGYLMTEYSSSKHSNLKCVDANPEKIRGQSGNNNGELFHFVEVGGTIPDPPYSRGIELTCVVCAK